MTVKFLWLILFFLCLSCSHADNSVVTNQIGGYTVNVLSDWEYVLDGSATQILASNSGIVTASLSISFIESEFETLDASFDEYVRKIPAGFKEYRSLGNGITQIDGVPARWHRMRDTDGERKFMNIVYVMQPVGKTMIVISCSSLEHLFPDYEEDFTKMCFSLKRLNN